VRPRQPQHEATNGPKEKEQFIEFMRLSERFCGVRVVMYCVMSNYFHVPVAGTIRQRLEYFRVRRTPKFGPESRKRVGPCICAEAS